MLLESQKWGEAGFRSSLKYNIKLKEVITEQNTEFSHLFEFFSTFFGCILMYYRLNKNWDDSEMLDSFLYTSRRTKSMTLVNAKSCLTKNIWEKRCALCRNGALPTPGRILRIYCLCQKLPVLGSTVCTMLWCQEGWTTLLRKGCTTVYLCQGL